MKSNAVSRINAHYKRVLVDTKNIDLFEIMTNRRDIRNSVVKKLNGLLLTNNHFETPIMANMKGNKMRLLDGNHRIEAIRRYLKMYPNRKVEVVVFYYDGLSPEEERQMYTKWNLGTKQTTNDFVKQYWDTIRLTKLIAADPKFPCKVAHTWGARAIEFKLLVGSYLTIDVKTFSGNYGGPAMRFIERVKKLTESDLKYIKAFMTEYIDVFGYPNKKNMHYKKAIFTALFRIWLDNCGSGATRMTKAFHRIRGSPVVAQYSALGSASDAVIQCRIDILRTLNVNRKKNLFK